MIDDVQIPNVKGLPVNKTRIRTLLGLFMVLVVLVAGCGESGSSDDDGASGGEDTGGADEGPVFEFVPLDVGGPTTKAALTNGDIDIALLFSSDGAIAANEWVALEDDKNLQPADNFVPAIRQDAVSAEVEEILNAVSGSLSVTRMQEMVAEVSLEGQNPADVAKDFLEDNNIPGPSTATGSIIVGSANFAESEIAAELYASALEQAGMTVERKLRFGARDTYIPALESGDIDLVPEFTGTLLSFLDPDASPSHDVEEVVEEAKASAATRGFTLLEPADADSVNTFVVTQETADEHSLEKVSDLANVEVPLTLGGPPECPERPFCLQGLQEVYGLNFDV